MRANRFMPRCNHVYVGLNLGILPWESIRDRLSFEANLKWPQEELQF